MVACRPIMDLQNWQHFLLLQNVNAHFVFWTWDLRNVWLFSKLNIKMSYISETFATNVREFELPSQRTKEKKKCSSI